MNFKNSVLKSCKKIFFKSFISAENFIRETIANDEDYYRNFDFYLEPFNSAVGDDYECAVCLINKNMNDYEGEEVEENEDD